MSRRVDIDKEINLGPISSSENCVLMFDDGEEISISYSMIHSAQKNLSGKSSIAVSSNPKILNGANVCTKVNCKTTTYVTKLYSNNLINISNTM